MHDQVRRGWLFVANVTVFSTDPLSTPGPSGATFLASSEKSGPLTSDFGTAESLSHVGHLAHMIAVVHREERNLIGDSLRDRGLSRLGELRIVESFEHGVELDVDLTQSTFDLTERRVLPALATRRRAGIAGCVASAGRTSFSRITDTGCEWL